VNTSVIKITRQVKSVFNPDPIYSVFKSVLIHARENSWVYNGLRINFYKKNPSCLTRIRLDPTRQNLEKPIQTRTAILFEFLTFQLFFNDYFLFFKIFENLFGFIWINFELKKLNRPSPWTRPDLLCRPVRPMVLGRVAAAPSQITPVLTHSV
jgi:hypothetical protein